MVYGNYNLWELSIPLRGDAATQSPGRPGQDSTPLR